MCHLQFLEHAVPVAVLETLCVSVAVWEHFVCQSLGTLSVPSNVCRLQFREHFVCQSLGTLCVSVAV